MITGAAHQGTKSVGGGAPFLSAHNSSVRQQMLKHSLKLFFPDAEKHWDSAGTRTAESDQRAEPKLENLINSQFLLSFPEELDSRRSALLCDFSTNPGSTRVLPAAPMGPCHQRAPPRLAKPKLSLGVIKNDTGTIQRGIL